jgi:hypothetical protein
LDVVHPCRVQKHIVLYEQVALTVDLLVPILSEL